jgi:two-component system chemotaxis response regulator CheY
VRQTVAKILVVDDSPFLRRRNAAIVKELGHEVIEAADGVQAVAAYKEHVPDAVLLDLTMPEMDGIAALKAILAYDCGAKVAICTVAGQHASARAAVSAGAIDFVVKPFESERVKGTLEKLCG